MIEMEFLVTRRLADDASTPAYHALMTVLRRPKARMAMVMPSIVSQVRSLWRNAFLKISLRMYIDKDALVELLDEMGFCGRPGVMCNHYDGLAEVLVQPSHKVENFGG